MCRVLSELSAPPGPPEGAGAFLACRKDPNKSEYKSSSDCIQSRRRYHSATSQQGGYWLDVNDPIRISDEFELVTEKDNFQRPWSVEADCRAVVCSTNGKMTCMPVEPSRNSRPLPTGRGRVLKWATQPTTT